MKIFSFPAALIFALGIAFPQEPVAKQSPPVTIVGYVRDSGCVHRFHEVVKPLPNGCVEACARGGSPLVLLTQDEHVYHPISAEMPDVDVRPKAVALPRQARQNQRAHLRSRRFQRDFPGTDSDGSRVNAGPEGRDTGWSR